MDTSKKYILMCEKAEEIQDCWKPAWLDVTYSKFSQKLHTFYFKEPTYCPKCKDYLIFIPRQDQLQEMVMTAEGCQHCKTEKGKVYWMLNFFYDFVQQTAITEGECYGGFTSQAFDTMEQLQISFVMHEKYGKTWNGKEWVKTQEAQR